MSPLDVLSRFLVAVESKDPAAVAACFAPNAVFRNVPHEAAIGREEGSGRSSADPRAQQPRPLGRPQRRRLRCARLAERTDRFWIEGEEYAVQCNGVIEVLDGLITELRDYVDLGVWRGRLGDVLVRQPQNGA